MHVLHETRIRSSKLCMVEELSIMGELGIGLYAFSAGNASVEIREYSYFAPPPHAARVDGISHRPADPTNTWLAVCKTALLPLYICDVERLLSNSPITQLSGIR